MNPFPIRSSRARRRSLLRTEEWDVVKNLTHGSLGRTRRAGILHRELFDRAAGKATPSSSDEPDRLSSVLCDRRSPSEGPDDTSRQRFALSDDGIPAGLRAKRPPIGKFSQEPL